MGFLRGIWRFVVASFVIAAGVAIYMYSMEEIFTFLNGYYEHIIAQVPVIPIENLNDRQIIGIVIGIYGLIKLWMGLTPKDRVRTVTFMGTHGEVTIELEPVENTLQRVAMKLPEVKNISLKLIPLEGNGRILVDAVAILEKSADDDARMVTARIHNFLQIHTRKIVGLQDVEAKLRVKRWHMKMKTVKVEPLLLESINDEKDTTSEKSTHTFETPKVMTTPLSSSSLVIETSQERKFGKL